jgi:hypothetical protein
VTSNNLSRYRTCASVPIGNLYIPDFILKPIVAYQRDANWRVLDLKKPNTRLLAVPANHVRLSHDVTQAIA